MTSSGLQWSQSWIGWEPGHEARSGSKDQSPSPHMRNAEVVKYCSMMVMLTGRKDIVGHGRQSERTVSRRSTQKWTFNICHQIIYSQFKGTEVQVSSLHTRLKQSCKEFILSKLRGLAWFEYGKEGSMCYKMRSQNKSQHRRKYHWKWKKWKWS